MIFNYDHYNYFCVVPGSDDGTNIVSDTLCVIKTGFTLIIVSFDLLVNDAIFSNKIKVLYLHRYIEEIAGTF